MHGDDEFRKNQSATLLGISELPYPSEGLVGQAGFLKDLLCLVSGQVGAAMGCLALEKTGILSDFLGGQGRDSDGATGALGLERSGRRRRAEGGWWWWRVGRAEAIKSRERALL